MRALTERTPDLVVRHLFEVGFCAAFVLYLLFLQSLLTYQTKIDLTVFLPVGLLFVVVSSLTSDTFVIHWPLAIVVGYIVGWIIRKLWKRGAIGQVTLVVLIGLNCLGFYSWFFMNAD